MNLVTMQAHGEVAHHIVHYVVLGISAAVGLALLVRYLRARRRS